MLAALGIRREPLTGWVRAPHEATVPRALAGIDGDALDAAIGAWLLGLQPRPWPVVNIQARAHNFAGTSRTVSPSATRR